MLILKKILLLTTLISSIIFLSSCDLADSLTTLPVNIPVSISFSTSGSNTNVSESSEFCIENNETYQQYQDKIQKIKILKIAIRTVSFSPQDMKANITVSVKDNLGNTLFSQALTDVSPGDFINAPYEFTLSADEIETFNNYLQSILDSGQNLCFTGTLDLQITSGNAPYSFEGAIDIVFEAETQL